MREALRGEIASFDIAGELDVLNPALQIAMGGLHQYKVKAWEINKGRLILHWLDQESNYETHGLFVPLEVDAVDIMIRSWLGTQDYGPEPQTDGSTAHGVHIYNDRWGQVEGRGFTSFVAVEPHWVIYGK